MTLNINRLLALGFTVADGDEDEEYPDYERVIPGGFGFTVHVQTHDMEWVRDGTPYGTSIVKALDKPRVRLHLPHSCDEWVIASHRSEDPARSAAEFARQAQVAHHTLTLALDWASTNNA